MRSLSLALTTSVVALGALGCTTEDAQTSYGPSTFHVEITAVNGNTPPTPDAPLGANHGDQNDAWDFTIEARSSTGEPVPFEGYVRLSVQPGAVMSISGDGAKGRNILLKGGKATGTALVTAVYGPTRLWVEDLGYLPHDPASPQKAACADGKDNDGDKLIDYPSDPGCAFPDDDTETGGTFAAAVSAPVDYALPRIADIRGTTGTPYPYEAIEVSTADPQHVVVTRVASDGFYITDIGPGEMEAGYNSVFVYNFSTPAGMRVCDRIEYLSGTANDFFGFTELSFPSFRVSYPIDGQGECDVPEPIVIKPTDIADPVAMRKVESSLVRVEGFHVSQHFGPGPALNNVFSEDASSCDFNGDGQIDYASPDEGSCSTQCDADPECSEWTNYSARGSYKVTDGSAMIKIATGTVSGFDPLANRGQVLAAVSGTLREFSGGTLNWTIETRCEDDLACGLPGCTQAPISSKQACVRLRTVDDNDEGTN